MTTVESQPDLADILHRLADRMERLTAMVERALPASSPDVIVDELISFKLAAAIANVHPTTIRRWTKLCPQMVVVTGAGARKIHRSMLADFIAGQSKTVADDRVY